MTLSTHAGVSTSRRSSSFAKRLSKKQQTLKNSVSISGVGLFSGETAKLTLRPGSNDSGVIFQRMDLPGKPMIRATCDFVQNTPRCTILGDNKISIQTVEHLLAALKGMEIDNVIVEVSAAEVPILDGSSAPFVEMIEKAGVAVQSAMRPVLKLKTPISWSLGDVHLIALPSDEYRISYTLHYPHSTLLGSQYYSIALTKSGFKKEIAPSRTFCLYEEITPMIDKGFIKGGRLENAVIIRDEKIMNPEGVRFEDEMVRHKILDLIGDLSLVPSLFTAHIVAIRSGHASNVAFGKELARHLIRENL